MRAWELDVKGIIEAGEEEAEALEKQLATDLHAVLAQSKYGVHHSVLGTPSVFGSVHLPQVVSPPQDAAPAPAPAPTVQPILPAAPAVPVPAAVSGPDLSQLLGGFDPAKLAQLAEFAQSLGIGVPTPPAPEVPAQEQ